jgi:menaquinone-9 beta-reductase
VGADEICLVVMADSVEEAALAKQIANWSFLDFHLRQSESLGRERGAVTRLQSLRAVTSGNVALVGDASGGVDAITGEGLRLAFQQALALADSLSVGDLKGYEAAHRRLARRPRLMSRLLLGVGRHEMIRQRLLQRFVKSPRLFPELLALHSQETRASRWMLAGASLGWGLLTT